MYVSRESSQQQCLTPTTPYSYYKAINSNIQSAEKSESHIQSIKPISMEAYDSHHITDFGI